MSMEKFGIVSDAQVDVIGVSAEDGACICGNCSRIVLNNQIKEPGICPFCQSEDLQEDTN